MMGFIGIPKPEKMVEINRQILGQNLNFGAYQLFAYLDTESKNYINEINIINFLQKRNGIPCSIEEIQFLVFFYDENFDGKLSYTEFLNFVLSDNIYYLRKRTRERVGSCYGKSIIPFIVEYSFVKLLQKELNLIRSTCTIIAELKSKNDFNVHDLFHYIKGYGCITSQSIKLFLLALSITSLTSLLLKSGTTIFLPSEIVKVTVSLLGDTVEPTFLS